MLQKAVALARVGPKTLQGMVHLAVQSNGSAVAEMVKERGDAIKK